MTPPLQPCGTIGAARRHERAGEPKCDACATVWSAHQAEMYRKRQERKAKAERARTKANRKTKASK